MPTSATGSKRPSETGFTLIELMVVLVLIGLASAAVVLAIPDPRGRVVDEAERFAVRARAVRDDAIVQGRTMALRIDGTGYAVERRAQGRWQAVGDRVFAPVNWTAGTGVTSPTSRISFDSTGAVADPLTVELSRDGMTARIDIPGDGAAHVARAEKGFTLIEMLVALAIFSLAALALMRLEGVTLLGTQRLADTTVAQVVARNLAVGILTDPRGPAIGTDDGEVLNGGQSWRWTRVTTRTDDARIVRVDLNVADANGRPMTRLSLARAVEMTRRAEQGFTLIEMMVALLIFAMIAAAGVALLSFGVRAQEAATTRLDDVAGVRRMSVLLANDLAQSVPRVARGADGAVLRAFTGNDGRSDPLVMGYVRGGWTNPDAKARPGIQRVDVTLNQGRLERRTYAAPDGDSPATTILLADKVSALAMRYRDKRGDWRERWDNGDIASLPAAVEMTVTRGKDAPLTLAFVAGPAYP